MKSYTKEIRYNKVIYENQSCEIGIECKLNTMDTNQNFYIPYYKNKKYTNITQYNGAYYNTEEKALNICNEWIKEYKENGYVMLT